VSKTSSPVQMHLLADSGSKASAGPSLLHIATFEGFKDQLRALSLLLFTQYLNSTGLGDLQKA
jgi:hypothetical protein